MPKTERFTFDIPASTQPQKLVVDFTVQDPVIVHPTPTVTLGAVSESHTLTGTTTPTDPPPTLPGRNNLIFQSAFETSSPFTDWDFETCNLGAVNDITQSADYSRSGSKAAKVVLNKGKTCPGVNSIRAEMKLDPQAEGEFWYGFSVLFPTGYKADPQCPEIFFQFHQMSGTGSPPLAFWSYGDRIIFNHYNIAGKADAPKPLVNITPGKWMDIVAHIKHSSGSDGITQVWVNQKLGATPLYSKTGINNYNATDKRTYLKMGLYKWGWVNGYPSTVSQRIIYLDEIRIGNNLAGFADVAP